ncbi:MAG: hypothetical protein HY425_01265 [Candidatus Levybacteria bacterium]|nr:hypothetical protein [Candidatus Levybacteria bacterium]
MGKEGGAKHDQSPLSQTMRELEKRNDELGGRLFAVFKGGRNRTLVFPTPVLKNTSDGKISIDSVAEFLFITDDKVGAIRVLRFDPGFANLAAIENLIKARLGKKPGFFTPAGYFRDHSGERLMIGGGFAITSKKAEKLLFSFKERQCPDDDNCRLVDIDDNMVATIIQLNEDRVNNVRKTSQAIESVLKAD